MIALNCSCGFAACAPGELTDHLHEAFARENDTRQDGHLHAEATRGSVPAGGTSTGASPSCLCGLTATTVTELDDHLLRAFTPAHRIGHYGARHDPVRA